MEVDLTGETAPAAIFVTQVVIGAILYTLLLIAAFLLTLLVNWMAGQGAPEWMISGAHWAERGIFWVDSFCFSLFLTAEVIKFIRGIVKELRK